MDAFQCEILFEQPHNYIAYRTEDLRTRTAKADASIHKFLLERVEEETKGLEVMANKVAIDVENLIKDALPSGIPSIHQIGEHMSMSNRTLTRRLSENGVTFRDLIRKTQGASCQRPPWQTRHEVLQRSHLKPAFQNKAPLTEPLKRWTEKSPLNSEKSEQPLKKHDLR